MAAASLRLRIKPHRVPSMATMPPRTAATNNCTSVAVPKMFNRRRPARPTATVTVTTTAISARSWARSFSSPGPSWAGQHRRWRPSARRLVLPGSRPSPLRPMSCHRQVITATRFCCQCQHQRRCLTASNNSQRRRNSARRPDSR